MKSNLISHIDQIPPSIARLCARMDGRPKTLKEIAKESGLSYRKANWIAMQPTWEDVKVGDAFRFANACDLDLLRPRRKLFYLKRAVALGTAGLKTLAGGLPVSYVVRQINIVKRHETKTTSKLNAAA
jgi:hypothetical protein